MDTTPGQYLKAMRERLQVGLREVQEASSVIANEEGNDNFYVSAARLTQIENERSIPSVYKLFTLCSIYGLDLNDLVQVRHRCQQDEVLSNAVSCRDDAYDLFGSPRF